MLFTAATTQVALQIWDIGGQSIGSKMITNYIAGAHVSKPLFTLNLIYSGFSNTMRRFLPFDDRVFHCSHFWYCFVNDRLFYFATTSPTWTVLRIWRTGIVSLWVHRKTAKARLSPSWSATRVSIALHTHVPTIIYLFPATNTQQLYFHTLDTRYDTIQCNTTQHHYTISQRNSTNSPLHSTPRWPPTHVGRAPGCTHRVCQGEWHGVLSDVSQERRPG